ncbi:hypothetical protein ID47_00485 [Candidatus Paracaedibacter acanthamoebae]|uniref:Uncharacterized protein n=1 Tax=Candidatus Odyssella acanthamoebae TaxID=91604 RepID=A0A077AV94_9PROT|nr:hypothetical protein ID47_00485 [Candidatus Paracaedibacter acanthamoebae]
MPLFLASLKAPFFPGKRSATKRVYSSVLPHSGLEPESMPLFWSSMAFHSYTFLSLATLPRQVWFPGRPSVARKEGIFLG